MGIRFFLRSNFPFFILIPSGLIRREDLIRSRIVTAPFPDALALRVSRLTRLSIPSICNSAESSMVMTRSSCGIKFDIAFRNVVFPEPVPPQMKMLYFAFTSISSTCATSGVMDPYRRSICTVIGVLENFRIVTIAPFREIGGSTTLTREPSGRRVSTIGFA